MVIISVFSNWVEINTKPFMAILKNLAQRAVNGTNTTYRHAFKKKKHYQL